MKKIRIHVDGGTAGTGPIGIAAVARSREGYFIGWRSETLGRMTNNEAEYRAAMLGLVLAKQLNQQRVEIISDSEVVVRQMRGLSRINSEKLRKLNQALVRAVSEFEEVTFQHVPRGMNHLADALATEAIAGRTVRMPVKNSRRFQHLFKRGS